MGAIGHHGNQFSSKRPENIVQPFPTPMIVQIKFEISQLASEILKEIQHITDNMGLDTRKPTCLRGVQQGKGQTGLLSYREKMESINCLESKCLTRD